MPRTGGIAPAVLPGPVAPALAQTVAPVVAGIAESAPARAAASVAAGVQDAASAVVSAIAAPKPEKVAREVELPSGHSFAEMLLDADVAQEEALAAAAALNKVYDHRRLKAGMEVDLTFTRLGTSETLSGATFQPESTKEVVLRRLADGQFEAKVLDTPLERQRVAVRTTVRSSLFETGAREGVPRSIMATLVRIYSHSIDFQRDLHAGDRLEILYDQPTARDGKPVGQGTIIYAALEVDGRMKPLYRVTFADGAAEYFDERGQSVKRTLLRTPVDGAHVTSGFGMRMHPLLGYTKMHKGVDFGAPTGTPILAAGSGVVEEVGVKGAYGRYVRIRHNGRMETAYAHMSRFARGMYAGARVNQGEVIGFVGTSGRSTGPHLHFEVHVDDRQVNPLSVSMPMGRVLEGQTLAEFRKGQTQIGGEFEGLLGRKREASAEDSGGSPALVRVSTDGAAAAAPRRKPEACGLRGRC